MATVTVISSSLLAGNSRAFQPMFSPVPRQDYTYFDDGPQVFVQPVSASMVGAINTTAVDPYAQGVEITRMSQYGSGLAKIWSGEAGHLVKQNTFGQDGNYFPPVGYTDAEKFSAQQFVSAQENASPLWDNVLAYPIIIGDHDQIDSYQFNGVIEPLSIRDLASLTSIDVPLPAHSFKGIVLGGNVDQYGSSDQVVTVDYFDRVDHIPPFLDANNSLEYGSSKLLPFTDAKYNRNDGTPNTAEDVVLVDTMDHMSGSTDNYVRYDQISAVCGWSYDNTTVIGTDSLPFGGLTY